MARNKWTGLIILIVSWVILILLPYINLGVINFRDQYARHILIIVGLNIILASSLGLVALTGLHSIGHAAFMGFGAYTSARLVMDTGIPFWFVLPLAFLVPAVIAAIVGIPMLRTKGIYFVILTLAFVEITRLNFMKWKDIFGGSSGILHIPPPDPIPLGFTTIQFGSKLSFYYLILGMALVCLLIIYRIHKSRIGMIFNAIRESDVLAQTVGINLMKYKVLAFAISAGLTGIAGAFYAHYFAYLSADTFTLFYSIDFYIFMVVGGEFSFFGPIASAAILTVAPEVFRVTKEYQPLIYAVILLLVMFFLPEGLVGIPKRLSSIRRKRVAPRGLEEASNSS